MQCSDCGLCCQKTEMLLSKTDIKRLVRAGYEAKDFVHTDKSGYARLLNTKGHCFFYQPNWHRCGAYYIRPMGCRIYPIIYSMEEGIIVDDFCPRWETVSKQEVDSKEGKLLMLLRKVDGEARSRS